MRKRTGRLVFAIEIWMRTRIYGKHGPTVIVLHGGPAALGEAAPVARGLSSKFVAVEALQRGSDQQLLTVSRHVEDLYQFIAGLKNDPRPSLVGESWGAMLALAYASAHPESITAVVLVGCGTFDQPSRAKMNEIIESRMDEQLRSRLRRLSQQYPDQSDRQHAERRLMERVYSYDPIARDEQMELVEPFDSRAHTETWNDMLRMQEDGTYPAAFSRIAAPVLMLHGDYDPHPGQMIYKSLRAYVPQIEYRELRNCGHSPWKERHARKEFFMLLTNWLLVNTDRH
jgi:pimeloyl-ACP methyl ester carboxylesterase